MNNKKRDRLFAILFLCLIYPAAMYIGTRNAFYELRVNHSVTPAIMMALIYAASIALACKRNN